MAAYFKDLNYVFESLRRLCRDGSTFCLVLRGSAPYGIYFPVEQWFGKLALAVEFDDVSFEKIRVRNIKWKNRKHRIPLHEGDYGLRGNDAKQDN